MGLDKSSNSFEVFDELVLALEVEFVRIDLVKDFELLSAEEGHELESSNGCKESQIVEVR